MTGLADVVKAAVDAADPMGLLAAGAPADEYGPEIDELVALAARGILDAAAVQAVFDAWFWPGAVDGDVAGRIAASVEAVR